MIETRPDASGLVHRMTAVGAAKVRSLDDAVTEHPGLGHGITLEGMNLLGRLFEDTAQEVEDEGRKLAEWAEARLSEPPPEEDPPAVDDLLGAAAWALNSWDSTRMDDGLEEALENLREVIRLEKLARRDPEGASPGGSK